ncbi:hypothetical protein ACSBR2_027600 [Camellia fascicularis]
MTIPISSVDQEDSVVWHHTKNGNFEVGHQNGASTSVRLPDKFWKLLWSLPVPPKVRNFWWKVFNQSEVDPMQVIRHASSFWREVCSVSSMEAPSPAIVNSSDQVCTRWKPSNQGMFKVCDASFASKGRKTTLAVILRDWRDVQLESDSKSVIDLCVSELVPPWKCLAFIHDIRSMSHVSSFSFSWVPREANCVAHWIASAKMQDALPIDWFRNPPLSLRNLLFYDSLRAVSGSKKKSLYHFSIGMHLEVNKYNRS